ncbi:MAG: DNA alkylation repair protein [Isosphaera sp.]|nr:DNA alkylation repair protein [Isosphaera sp.]
MAKKSISGAPTKSAKSVPAPAEATTTTPEQILRQLESLGNEATRKHNTKWGAGANQYGVKHGDIRALAKKIQPGDELVTALWETGNVDAQLLAALLIKPKTLPAERVDRLVRSISFAHVADWLISYVVKPHADKEALRQKWMADGDRWAARAGWALTAERVVKGPDGLDLPALLDRIESEMGAADPVVQWTMNSALAEIGIRNPALRKRAMAIGEKLGIYRDYPCPKGCTSPFAPIWINAMVSRQG